MNTQKTQTTPDQESLIGVLLIEAENKEQIGLIKFSPQGVLIYQLVTNELHVYAFKGSIVPAISKWIKDPLYVKYAKIIEDEQELPDSILEKEADDCTDFLNACKAPIYMGKHTVKARKVSIKP